MSDFNTGTVATLKAEFVNASGALTDPSAINLTITAPDQTVSTFHAADCTHVSTGVYSYNLTLSQAGIYAYEFDGTGTVPADGIGYLNVVSTTGNTIHTGPCSDWCSIDDVRNLGAYSSATTLSDPQILRMIPIASKVLYTRTARRFSGICEATVRPSRRPRGPLPFPWFNGWLSTWNSSWGMDSCWLPGGPFTSCQCEHPSEVTLGYYPVRQILEVRQDGAVVSPSAYRLDDHRQLTRIDGNAWLSCQDLTADPLTAVNTFQVKLLYGIDPPVDGVLAAAVLAGELALANTNQTCRLPRRMVTLTRQGVTTQVFDPTSLMKDGLVGVFEIDSFIGSDNPHGLTRRATITSPDVRSPVRRTGW